MGDDWGDRELRRRQERHADDTEYRVPGKKGSKAKWCGGHVGRPHLDEVEEDYRWGGRSLGKRYVCPRCKKVLRTVYRPTWLR